MIISDLQAIRKNAGRRSLFALELLTDLPLEPTADPEVFLRSNLLQPEVSGSMGGTRERQSSLAATVGNVSTPLDRISRSGLGGKRS